MAEPLPQSESESLQLTRGGARARESMLDLDTWWCRECESGEAEAHVTNRSRASFNRMGPIPRSFSGGRTKSPSHCSQKKTMSSRPFLLSPFSFIFYFIFLLSLNI